MMLKKLTLFHFCFFMFQSLLGQVSYGLKGGLNISSSRLSENILNLKPKCSFHAGAFFEFAAIKNLSVRTEFLYSRKGYLHTSLPDSSSYAIKRFNYISVPVLISVPVVPKINILFGPEISILTSAKSKYKGTIHDWSRPMSKIDKAIDLGLSFQFTNDFGIELLYSYGLKGSEIWRYTDFNGAIIREEKIGANQVLQIGLLYKLPHRKGKV